MQKPQPQKSQPLLQAQPRKTLLAPFYEHLSKLHILHDLTSHQILLNTSLQADHLNIRKLPSQVIESVPLRFTSVQNYVGLWLRLFYEEAKCQIQRARVQEPGEIEPVDVMELRDYDDGSGIEFKLFLLHRVLPSSQQHSTYSPNTLVLLSPTKPHPQTNYPHLIGFIEPGQTLSVRILFNQAIKKGNEKQWQLMTSTKRWYIQQVCSVNTLEREFYALKCVERIGDFLLRVILRPEEHVQEVEKKFRIPGKLDVKLRHVYNESQYKAIGECLRQTGITLIQGPPGTGKTKTVLGTLSVLLSSYHKNEQQQFEPLLLNWRKSSTVSRDNDRLLNPWLYPGYTDWRDIPYIQTEDDPLNLTSCYLRCETTDRKIALLKKQASIELPQKVLICGPSNASVDEIIRKLLKEQLIDGDGHGYLPAFVRVGEHYDASLKEYSLESLAEKLAQKEHGTDLNAYRMRILKEYRLVFSTLSAAGNQIMQTSNVKFDTVVIDQAGQSIQISNLIPLLYGCQRLILIGDPNQLPATVFSQKSLQHNYDQSLFQRLMKSGYPVNILKMQYRMHPEISAVIGANFYGQKLVDWEKIVVEEPKVTPSAFVIFHLDQAPESAYRKSFRNTTEARAVKDFAVYLSKHYDDIGIVSPYSQQVSLLQSLLPKSKKCQIKTIDSFQGRQKQVIIFSSVRSRFIVRNKKIESNKRKTIGFVGDLRRINVSLSRARSLCVIFGDVKRLGINGTWRNIIREAMANKQVFQFSHKKNFFQAFKQEPQKYLLKQFQFKQ